ncbi:MAG: hypothetical protein A2X86_01340 [Bdellovibrionales bacterium GWA2_49_15]|nr:MAG: hypothetical protein A2X86_01340 [Bdellovibrionales bacterium GWA2_49_15]
MSKIGMLLCFLVLIMASPSRALNIAIFGDAGRKTESVAQVLQSIVDSQVKDVALVGDNLYDMNVSYGDVWDDWFSKDLRFPVVAIGNHRLSYLHEREYFRMPAEYYAQTVEDVRFIVLNSDNAENVMAQRDFFLKEMARPGRSEVPFTFIVFHHPPATLSERHQWIEKKHFHDTFRPLLLQYRNQINGLFVGHDHVAAIYSLADIPLVVSGAVFEFFPIKTVTSEVVPGFSVKSLWTYRPGPHWVRLETYPKTHEAYVHFIKVEGKESKVVCSVLLKSRQIALKRNCQQ